MLFSFEFMLFWQPPLVSPWFRRRIARQAPFSGIGAAQAGGRGDEQHLCLREQEANSEPVMDMAP